MRDWKKLALSVGLLVIFAGLLAVWRGAWLEAAAILVAGVAVVMFIYVTMAPYDELVEALDRLAAGDLSQPALSVETSGSVGTMATAINQLTTQLRLLSEEAMELSEGFIGVRRLQQKVLETGQLSAVDLPTSSSQGDLNRSFAHLTNQMRRLTVKAYIIANDQLFNPALDEKLPGELGEAFGMMVSNLRTLAGRAERIAQGDLTSHVEGDGDLTNVFNNMISGLRQLVEEILNSAVQVASSTEEMLHVLKAQEQSSRHQAQRIRQTQLTVAGLFNSSDAIAASAQQVFRVAKETSDQTRQIGDRIEELNQHSGRIAEILHLIREIADRSDLLALNASLEGARAGHAGMGFSLVAEEMRRLAENIMDSVGKSTGLVHDINEASKGTATACREGVIRSEETTDVAMQIRVVTQEQRENTGEVNRAMEDLSGLVTQGVAGIRQVTVAASELARLSVSLREVVERFEVTER